MALVKPIIQPTNSYGTIVFDANQSFIFNFIANSGDQYIGNNLVIYDSSTGTEVYNQTIISFIAQHPLSSGILTNGETYQAKIRTKDSSNNYSNFSDIVSFICLSSPVVQFTNITNGKIGNATYNFQTSYSQSQSEILQSYKFYLYDSDENLLSSSPEILFAKDNSLAYEFSGLLDGETYHIKMECITVHYMETSTGLISFIVSYITPRLSSALTLENIESEGGIKATAEIIQILIDSSTGTISYTDNNDAIDLTQGSISYQTGFSIKGDFTLQLWCRKITEDEDFLILYGDNNVKLKFSYYNNVVHCFKYINNTDYVYAHYASNEITISSETDKVYMFVQSINDRITIQAGLYT